ncbi:MAG: hypothetical protein GAS50_11270 [Desulfobacterales bacterium]|jgi:hypothetical protein|nr:hypothetical protein [Desulfobacterales bacterium]
MFGTHRRADGVIPKTRRIRTRFKEYTIEIFQWKKMAVVGFQADENGWKLVRW